MIPGVEYTRHIPKAMREFRYKVVYSDTAMFKPGDEVYKVREKPGKLLIGFTFHRSLDFDPETLECYSIVDGRLLAKVERIK